MNTELIKRSRWSVIWAILLIVLGLAAIAAPLATSLTMAIVIGWLLILSAVTHVLAAFRADGMGSTVWTVLIGALYGAIGVNILSHPLWGVATLTLVISAVLLVEGAMGIAAYFAVRHIPGSIYLLLNAIVTLVLGCMIWIQWPSSSLWVIGTLVGINLVMTGATRLMLTAAARRISDRFAAA
jgi:uncharacterized membrane protein HdeD (DUF308 family)